MISFALVSIEKDYKVDVSEGKVTVGRGPFLKASFLQQIYPCNFWLVTFVYILQANSDTKS